MRVWKQKLAPKDRPTTRRAIVKAIDTLEPRRLMAASYVNDSGGTTAFSSTALTVSQGEAVFVTAVTPQAGATSTTASGLANAMTAKFAWDFGDTANEGKVAHANGITYDDNVADGWTASHVYDTPGTYTIKQKIDGADTLTQVVTVTASARTVKYVDTFSEATASGTGTQSTPYNLRGLEAYLGTLTTTAAKTNIELRFATGKTYAIGQSGGPFVNGMNFSGFTNLVVDAAATNVAPANRPNFRWSRDREYDANGRMQGKSMFTLGGATDVAIQNVQVSGFNDADTDTDKNGLQAVSTGNGKRIVVRNVRFRDVDTGVQAEGRPTGVLMQDSTSYAESGAAANDLRAYLFWMQGRYLSIVGNKAQNSTVEHILRGGGYAGDATGEAGLDRDILAAEDGWFGVNIANNDLANNLQLSKTTVNLQGGAYANVSANVLRAVASVGPLGGGNTGNDDVNNRTKYAVFEGNTFANATLQVQHGTSDVDIRQNRFDVSGQGYNASAIEVRPYALSYTFLDSNNAPQTLNYNRGTSRVRVLYNTFDVGAGSNSPGIVAIGGGANVGGHADHEVAGNVVHLNGGSSQSTDRSILIGSTGDRQLGGGTTVFSATGNDEPDVGNDAVAFAARTFKAGGVGQNYWHDDSNNGGTIGVGSFAYSTPTQRYSGTSFASIAAWNGLLEDANVRLRDASNAVRADAVQAWSLDASGAPATAAADVGIGYAGGVVDGTRPTPVARPAAGSGTWTVGAIQRATQPPTSTPVELTSGTLLSSAPATGFSAADVFDKNFSTYFYGATNGNPSAPNYVGRDLGAAYRITEVRYASQVGKENLMNGGVFQGANQADFSDAVTLAGVGASESPSGTSLTTKAVTDTGAYRYVRYLAPSYSYGRISELEFWGTAATPTAAELSGTRFSSTANSVGMDKDAVFDNSFTTGFYGATNGNSTNPNFVGLDLGTAKRITEVQYASVLGKEGRMNGGIFQGSNVADFSTAVTLATIGGTENPSATALTTRAVTDTGTYRYVRYLAPSFSYGQVSELKFIGY